MKSKIFLLGALTCITVFSSPALFGAEAFAAESDSAISFVTPIQEQETSKTSSIQPKTTTYYIDADDFEYVDMTEDDFDIETIKLNKSKVNYGDVYLISGQSKAFVNYDGNKFHVPANTYTQFYYELPNTFPSTYYEMGYYDGAGRKKVLVDNESAYGYVDFRVKFFEDTDVMFYIKNTQSNPYTVKNIKFNFPV